MPFKITDKCIICDECERVKRGLSDKSMNVRLAFAQRDDIKLTKAQIERGLTDRYSDVRAAFAQRTDFTPTAEQVERGLTDDWLISLGSIPRTLVRRLAKSQRIEKRS